MTAVLVLGLESHGCRPVARSRAFLRWRWWAVRTIEGASRPRSLVARVVVSGVFGRASVLG